MNSNILCSRNIFIICFVFVLSQIFIDFASSSESSSALNRRESNADWRNYRKNKENNKSATIVKYTLTSTSTISTSVSTSSIIQTILTTATTTLNDEDHLSTEIINTHLAENEINIQNVTESNHETDVAPNKESSPDNSETAIVSSTPVIPAVRDETSFLRKIIAKFDRYSLILTSAFLACLLVLILLILLSLCICKSSSRFKRRDKKAAKTLTTNPVYDQIVYDAASSKNQNLFGSKIYLGGEAIKQDDLSPKSKRSSSETRQLIDKQNIELVDLKNSSIRSIDSLSSASSTSSIDSVIEKTPKTPKTPIAQTPSSLNKSIKSSFSNLTQKLTNSSRDLASEKSCLLSEEQESNNKDKLDGSVSKLSNQQRFTPNQAGKTQQQISKEQQNSRRSLLFSNRTKSESNEDQTSGLLSKRVSITSSNGSIVMAHQSIDFSQIQTGVDDLINDINMNKSNTSSTNNVGSNADSSHNSLSNIYMDALREKREQEKLAKSSKSYKNEDSRRRSVNMYNSPISVDPSGNVNNKRDANYTNRSGNLNASSVSVNNDTMSVNTIESEKSCY